MAVGAVGPVGGGAAGAMSGAGATSGAAATPDAGTMSAPGTAGAVQGESNPVTSLAQMEINASSNMDFNSVDLLIALLLMAAGRGKEDKDSAGSTALGFLAGLALAGALGQQNFNFEFSATGPVDAAGGATASGGQLNVTA